MPEFEHVPGLFGVVVRCARCDELVEAGRMRLHQHVVREPVGEPVGADLEPAA